MKTILSILTILILSNLVIAQTTAIPDSNFEQELINLGYDTGIPDGVVLTSNIDNISSLNVSWKNISDLSGIEDFTALTSLNCGYNSLTTVNITQNTLLTSFSCFQNQLVSLDVSQNLALIELHCGGNQLSSIDVTQHTSLQNLGCCCNQLSSINVSQNLALNRLVCGDNQLSSIDVTQNSLLDYFNCSQNNLTSLDVSQNAVLGLLNCEGNLLNCLNVKNGNNTSIATFFCEGNPNLTCIEVDNVTYSNSNWTFIDPQIYFSTNCSNPCSVGIDEHNFTKILVFPNPTTGNISIDLGEIKTNLTVSLSNSLGQVILTQQFLSTAFINLEIDTPKGIYFLKLETPIGENKTIKILKE